MFISVFTKAQHNPKLSHMNPAHILHMYYTKKRDNADKQK
jgi:hypothetical protein